MALMIIYRDPELMDLLKDHSYVETRDKRRVTTVTKGFNVTLSNFLLSWQRSLT